MSAAAPGTIRLGEVAARLRMLEVACSRCNRRGRLNAVHLLNVHGNRPVPELLERLSADCMRRMAMQRGQLADVCGIHCPELPKLF